MKLIRTALSKQCWLFFVCYKVVWVRITNKNTPFNEKYLDFIHWAENKS